MPRLLGLLALAVLLTCPLAHASDFVLVQKGQSLSSIAAQHKLSLEQLCQWNNIDAPNKIKVGQKIYLGPTKQADSAVAAKAQADTAVTAKAPSDSPAPNKTPDDKAKKAAPGQTSASGQPDSEVKAPDDVPAKVKSELAALGTKLVNNASRTIMPSAKSKAVAASEQGFVASYIDIDTSSMRAEVMPSKDKGKYVGSIRYLENQYECPGATRAEALKAECVRKKSRRINELVRYEKGKWHY